MAVENGVQNAELGYLLFPFEQYSNLAGKPLVGGHLEIYEAGTDTKYISYQNWDGAENPFRIPIPSDGRITVLADPTKTFDCYLYDSYNNLVCSRLNVQANVPGSISISGADTQIKNTDGTLDISLRTLGNNVREYTVNTHNKVLDVQSPLYFVENSNSATVIGFSGDNYVQKDYLNEYVASSISGKMDESKLEYNSNGEISAYDGSAFAGQGGAGDPAVNDLVHANSATWNEVSAKLDTTAFSTVSSTFLTAIPDNYATKDYVQSSVSSKLDSTAFSTVSSDFLTAHQSLDGLMSASLLGMSGNTITSYNNMPFPIGGEGDAEVNQIVHANSATWNDVSAKLDTSAFSTVSSNFLTAHQDLSDYVTKESADASYYPLNSNPSGYLTAHQSLDGYLTKASADTLYQPSGNYANATALDGKVDTSSFTAFSSTTKEKIEYISGALSGTYELSAGNGIDITDYPNEQKTVISVTAQGGNQEAENLVTAQSATWNSVTGKQDSLNFEYNGTAISSVNGSGLYDISAQARINTLAGRISSLSSDKLDTTAFSTVSSTFLTAHQDISNLMPKSESANFYPMTGNPSGFLTEHQSLDGYLQNTDLTIVDDKITKISGVPLSAGDELPDVVSAATDYVTANSATINSTIDNVSSNSAVWGGEALPLSSRDGIDLELSGDTLLIGASAINEALNNKQDALTFDYNANNAISAINGSALAGGGGSVDPTEFIPWSASGSFQESGDYYSASNLSGFITTADITGKQDTLTFEYDADSAISSINGSALAGGSSDTGTYIDYYNKPSATASQVRASGTSLIASDLYAYTDSASNFHVAPWGFEAKYGGTFHAVLNPGGFTAAGVSANPGGVTANTLTSTTGNGFESSGTYHRLLVNNNSAYISGNKYSLNLTYNGAKTTWQDGYAEFNDYGLSFSGSNDSKFNITTLSEGNPGIYMTGANTAVTLEISNSACKMMSGSNALWDALNPTVTYLWNGGGSTNTAMPFLLASAPVTGIYDPLTGAAAAAHQQSLRVSATYNGLFVGAGTAYKSVIDYDKIYNSGAAGYASLSNAGITYKNSTGTWSLQDSIQKSEIEGDSATSSISAIAGSAIAVDTSNLLTVDDASAFYTTANESGFITGVDLTPYQTTAEMTAYQAAGDYYSASNPSAFITQSEFNTYSSSVIPTQLVATSAEATGTNILYVVTGE